jgi:Flavodoxins
MKTLIIYQSIHHGNTEKVAKKIAEVLGADLKKPNEVKPEDLADYDLIGFGSGIYYSKFHVTMLKFVDSLPEMSGKKTFIFYTHGAPVGKFGKKFAEKLTAKGLSLAGEFQCRGFDTFGPFKLIGGLCKGHPDEKDLSAATQFAEDLKFPS